MMQRKKHKAAKKSDGGKNLITRSGVESVFRKLGGDENPSVAAFESHNAALEALKGADCENAWKTMAQPLRDLAADLVSRQLAVPRLEEALPKLNDIADLPAAFERYMADGTAHDEATRDALSAHAKKGTIHSFYHDALKELAYVFNERVKHYVNHFNAIWTKLWRFMGEAGPTLRKMYDTLSDAAYKEMELRQKTVRALNKAMGEIKPHLGEVNLDNLPALPENSQGGATWLSNVLYLLKIVLNLHDLSCFVLLF